MGEIYDGPVVFVEDVHYPVGEDGHADRSRPLRRVHDGEADGGGWRDAEEGEPLHNDVHAKATRTLDPSMIEVHAPGLDVYPVGAHVVSADGATYYLADEFGYHIDGVPLTWDAATETFRGQA